MIKLFSLGLLFLGSSVLFNTAYGQINTKEYLTPREVFDKGMDYFLEEDYVKAYDQYMTIDPNDTAYFDAMRRAVESASMEDRYDTVIQLCSEVLASKQVNPYREFFYTSSGDGYMDHEDYNKAVEILTEGLGKHDRSGRLYYNRARAYYNLEKYDEAIVDLQSAISYRPRYSAAHFLLGAICAEAGEYTRAALSLNMAVYVDPTSNMGNRAVMFMQDLYAGNVEMKIDKLNFKEDEDFAETDLLIKNKLAENPKYKVKSKLKLKFIRHTQLMFEKMAHIEGDNGFWNQNYVKYFKDVFDKGQYEYCAYYQCIGLEDNFIQVVIKKKKAKIVSFITESGPLFTDIINERKILENGKYVDNELRHIGVYGFDEEVGRTNGQRDGHYIGYNNYGQVTSDGTYSNGEMVGTWSFYELGVLKTIAEFKVSKLDGDRTSYYGNGARRKTIPIKEGVIDGTVTTYLISNQVYSTVPFDSEGNENGEAIYYFSTGELSYKINYTDGQRNGDYTDYYRNGQKRETFKYVEGSKEGPVKMLHKNGKVYIEGQYKDNKSEGHWKYFYDNGQLEEEGEFLNGNRVGVWKNSNQFGILNSETDFGEKGTKTGVYKSYDLEGNLKLELVYKGEEINEYTTYDAAGNVLSRGEKKKRELDFVGFHDNGVKRVEGKYYKGDEVGLWQFYNLQGMLVKELNYDEDGLLNGRSNWYFENGEIEIIKEFSDGYLDGYFVEYYRNGDVYNNGWYKEGDKVGAWEKYERGGALIQKMYYLEDEIHGDVLNYNEKGLLSEISTYFYGVYQSTEMYDTLGNVLSLTELKDGAAVAEFVDAGGKVVNKKNFKGGTSHGEITGYYSDGTLRLNGQYFGGSKIGIWKWYSRDGVVTTEGEYVSGSQEGDWKWYYDNGKVEVEKTFIDGNTEGKVTKYHENGKIKSEQNYRNDELHGTSTFYCSTGQIKYFRYYDDGFMLGYSYLGSDGKPVAMIEFSKSDGVMETFYQNGETSYHTEYKGGYTHGKNIHYHFNGKVASERVYIKSQLDGVYKDFHTSGKLKEESNYFLGDLQGLKTTYHPNGKVKSTENYIIDELYGTAEYFDVNGKLIETSNYYSGRIML